MRDGCPRCLRPTAFCVCAGLAPVPSRTRVVLLQHPREARLAICSAWLTRISLENAEILRGVSFEGDPRVAALAALPGAAVLWPGEASVPAASRVGAPPPVLFAVDGTWHQAGKMLRLSPTLARLPRISIDAGRPSGYAGLRAEPGEVHLSTLEAVALALSQLEGDPVRFAPMVAAFHRSVALQIACARSERRTPRHRGTAWRDRLPGAQHEEDGADDPGEAEGQVEETRRPRPAAGEGAGVGPHHAADEAVPHPQPGGQRAGDEEHEDDEPVHGARAVE
ncbi:MAG: tRNA-uridine aminocarboxypropyltransferase [Anaeromyxobacteraceae bacterium]